MVKVNIPMRDIRLTGKPGGRYGGSKKGKKGSLVKTIKTVAKSEALKLLETKFVTQRDNAVTFNSAIDGGYNEMYTLIPKCSQGVGTWQRVEDSVQPISIRTNWHIALGPNVRSSNIRCVLYCLQSKSIKYFPDLQTKYPLTGPDMLKTGSSALTQVYSGRIVDENLPINNDEFTILKKFTFNLMANVGAPNGDTTAGNSPNALPSFKNLSYTYKCKSPLKYTPTLAGTASTEFPNGHAPFWVFGYSHTDGTSPDVLNRDVLVSYMNQMSYKDA